MSLLKCKFLWPYCFYTVGGSGRIDGQMDGQTDGETTTTATLNAAACREGRTFDHIHTVNERYVRYATDRQTGRQTNITKTYHFRW